MVSSHVLIHSSSRSLAFHSCFAIIPPKNHLLPNFISTRRTWMSFSFPLSAPLSPKPSLPSGGRLYSMKNTPQTRSDSGSLNHHPRAGSISGTLSRRDSTSQRASTPQAQVIGNMANLQRMDLVKARTGSVLSRGFILKTDHHPPGRPFSRTYS